MKIKTVKANERVDNVIDLDFITEEYKEDDPPSLLTINEFLRSLGRSYPVESLGGFIYWAERKGVPKRWPKSLWEEALNEFLNRKVA